MRKALCWLMVLLLLFGAGKPAVRAETIGADGSIEEDVDLDAEEEPGETAGPEAPESTAATEAAGQPAQASAAKEAFIEDIIALGQKLYEQADGKLQRAHYARDIYVCKNFTVYLFRQNRDKYRIGEYPDVQLRIPNNQPAAKCKPYYYGYCWEEITPEKGNPFYEAAQFLYDTKLSKEENMELALAFMRQVKRGDYFQMTAKYSHGTGAHSAIMISDYDPETDTVHWMDSNMAGKRIKGIRYGKVQFDAVKEIQWWAEAFCQKKRGATLYRLRDDLIFAEEAGK